MRVQVLAFLLSFTATVYAGTSVWNGSSWSGVDITDAKKAVRHDYVINADYTLTGTASIKGLTVGNGVTLTLDNANLTVEREIEVYGNISGTGTLGNSSTKAGLLVSGVVDLQNIILTADEVTAQYGGHVITGSSTIDIMAVDGQSALSTTNGTVINTLTIAQRSDSESSLNVNGYTTINTKGDISAPSIISDTLEVAKLLYFQSFASASGSGLIDVVEGASLVNYSLALDVLQRYKRTWSDNTYAFVCMPTDGQTHSFPKKVYDWNESYSAPGSGWVKIAKGGGLTRGEGYIAFAAGEKEFTGYTDLFPVSVPVTLSSGDGKPDKDVGANLTGNPYACPLSFSAFVNANAGLIEPEIYYWSDGGKDTLGTRAGDYIVKNSIGASGAIDGVDVSDDNIASMQAFFTRALANGTLTINQSMILPEADNTNSLKSGKISYDKLRIAVENESLYNDVLVGFVSDEPVESLKAKKKRGNTNFSFHIISEEDELAITAIDESLFEEIHIPLGIYVSTATELSISLKSQDLTFAVDSIILVNKVSGERYDIEYDSHQLSCNAGDNNNWEVVLYKSSVVEEPAVEDTRKKGSNKYKKYKKERKIIAEYYYNFGGRKYHKRGNRKYYLELKRYSDGTYEKYMRRSR